MQVAGVPVGKVASIALTPDGEADVAMRISDDGYHPLRRGTRAIIRQASLSGVANRYVDLQLPAADHQRTIPPGGVIEATETASAVDLDQLFNTFDPKTRKALSGVVRGYARAYAGSDAEANGVAGGIRVIACQERAVVPAPPAQSTADSRPPRDPVGQHPLSL